MAFQFPSFPIQFAPYPIANGFAINVPLQFGTTETATGFGMLFVTIGFANYPIYQGLAINVPVHFGLPETRTGFEFPIIYPKGLGGTPPLLLVPPSMDFSLDIPTPTVVIPHLSAVLEPLNFDFSPQIPHVFASFQTTSPQVEFDLTIENPTVHAGANLFVEPLSFALEMPAPSFASAQIIFVPTTEFDLTIQTPTVHAGAHLYPPALDFELKLQIPKCFSSWHGLCQAENFFLTLETPSVFVAAVVNVPASAFDLGMPPPRIMPFVPSLGFDLEIPVPTVVVSFISTADPFDLFFEMPTPKIRKVILSGTDLPISYRVLSGIDLPFYRELRIMSGVDLPLKVLENDKVMAGVDLPFKVRLLSGIDLPFYRELRIMSGVDLPLKVLENDKVMAGVDLPFKVRLLSGIDLPFYRELRIMSGVDLPFMDEKKVLSGIDLPFKIQDKTIILSGVDLPFTSIEKPSIFVVSDENYAIHQGQRVDLLDYMISQDWDTYLWTGQMSIANHQDYARMRKNDAIILVLQGVDYTLVIQNRSHSDDGNNGQAKFTIDVASPTVALSDKNLKISKAWGAVMASVAAQAIVEQPIDWQIVDWLLPAGRLSYENANPMELLRKLVDAAGGIVQTTRTGSLKVQYKTPCAINKLSASAIDFTFSDTAHIFNYDERTPSGDFFNAAIITDTDNAVDRQWSGEYIPTDDVSGVLRVYGHAWLNPDSFEVTTTGNPSIKIGQGVVVYIEENQTLEFKKGQASTSYPVFILRECVWKYANLGELMWELDSPQLKTAAPSYSVAELKYTRRVVDFPIRHNVQDLETSQFLVAEYVD